MVEIAGKAEFNLRTILNRDAIQNAIVVDMAMGGSSNTILHLLAISREAGAPIDLADIEAVASKVAHVAKIAPSLSTVHIEDVHRAGGVPAVLKEIARRGDAVKVGARTVTGETIGDRIAGAEVKDRTVIHDLEHAYSPVGGIAVLRGNLALEGAVVKTAGIEPGMRKFTGTAVCFDSQDDCIAGILSLIHI